MGHALAVLALLWPLAQAASVAAAAHGSHGTLTVLVPVIGSRVCHRRPERSFHTAGVQWPVCARCSGLYVGAAAGAWFGLTGHLRRWIGRRRMAVLLIVASVPTAVSWAAEWGVGLPMANVTRAIAAMPLGAAVGAAIVAVAASPRKANQVN
jgi:uncharacterized membrane protein